MDLVYDIKTQRLTKTKFNIHDFSYNNLYPYKLIIVPETKELEIKVTGKTELLNINESILIFNNKFEFDDMLQNIIDSKNGISIECKYQGKESKIFNIKFIISYKQCNPKIISSIMYGPSNYEICSTILKEIKQYLNTHKVSYVIFSTDIKINSIKLEPIFYCLESDTHNSIENPLISYELNPSENGICKFDIPDFFKEDIDSYCLTINSEQQSKIGITVFGF